MTRTLIRTVLLALSLVVGTAVLAGDVEDGDAAFAKKDYAAALKKFKSAAAKNDANAQLNVGSMYNFGRGVAQDYSEAVRLYKAAAAKGSSKAQVNLGLMYAKGEGVLQDYAEAARLYKLAAAQGEEMAQSSLGIMYYNGQGAVQDYVRAHMWTNLAAVNGDTIALKNRDIFAAKMSTQQIAEAQKLARECQARNFKGCD